MSVRLRLTRVGSKKNPIWRVVVADQRSPRDGRFIESIGHYNPQTDPSTIVIDESRLEHWLSRGAEPTGTVKNLIKANSRSAEAPAPAETAAPDEPEPAPAEPAEDSSPEQAAPGEAVAPAEDDNPAAAASGEGDPPAEESAG